MISYWLVRAPKILPDTSTNDFNHRCARTGQATFLHGGHDAPKFCSRFSQLFAGPLTTIRCIPR